MDAGTWILIIKFFAFLTLGFVIAYFAGKIIKFHDHDNT
jgi:hypothetical protein